MLTKALRLTGELLIVAAIVIGLWLVYENAVTNTIAKNSAAAAVTKLEQNWRADDQIKPQQHEAFALLYIPRLRSDVWGIPVIEGISQPDLVSGVGHYPQSDLPGQYGNFAIAGHRVTHGQPFYDFPKLRSGDSVFVQTKTTWYEYRLFASKFVTPNDAYVVGRNPGVDLPADASRLNLITLTTCDPAWNSYRRWIWWGTLVGTYSTGHIPLSGVKQ